MSKQKTQFLLAVAVLVALFFAFRKKECVSSTLSFPGFAAGPVPANDAGQSIIL